VLFVDSHRLAQVVMNLLTNAIKYAEKDPQSFSINVDVNRSLDSIVIKFEDSGIGIKKGHVEQIFRDGFRTPEATKRDVTGSGLGLAISRKIMRELGGDLRLAKNQKPTEFHVIFPKALEMNGE
jgi:two-component system phosphate regulon sensor histidine kinase PhoR